ncbi:MAG: hypothetical protein ACYSR3_06900 [Planctomycetota bacterium]|jgi:hypothetical protein
MKVKYILLSSILIFLFSYTISFSEETYTQDAEAAIIIAQQDPRVEDVLIDFPGLKMDARYSDEYGVWIIEFLSDSRETGVASVSLEQEKVLEFEFNIDEISEGFEDDRDAELDLASFFRRLRPRLEGAAFCWISILLVFIFLGDFSRLFSRRNFDILLLYLICPFLLVLWENRKFSYAAIFVVTILFFIRCLYQLWNKPTIIREDNVHFRRAAIMVLILACVFHGFTVYERPMDDSGLFSVIGAAYIQETGKLPYGSEYGHLGVYGPLLYMLHIPANWMFESNITFDTSNSELLWGPYEGFEMRGGQTIILIFDLLAMLALYCFGKKYADKNTGVLLALVYALCPYVIGIGGAGGLQWTSHTVGTAFVVFALVWMNRPLVSGLLLGLCCGMLYYPLFLLILWFGYYVRSSGWCAAFKFLGSFALVGLACLIMIIVLTEPSGEYEGLSSLGAFIQDTVYQQQFSEGYGQSGFSFWGQFPDISKWGKPAAGIIYILFCLLIGFIPRKMHMRELVALTAAVLVGTQFVLSHGGGTYIGFYIAPFIIMLFGTEDYTEV